MIGQKLKTAPPTGGHVFQRIGTTFELNQDIIKTNVLTNFELGRDFIGTKLLTKFHEDGTRNQMLTDERTDIRRTKTGHKSSPEQSVYRRKNAPPTCGHVFQATGTNFKLVQNIIGTNLLTKFHDDRTINMASRVLTRKNAMPPWRPYIIWTNHLTKVLTRKNGGHVLQPTCIIFELVQDIIGMNLLTKFHEDQTINVASRVKNAPPLGSHVFQANVTIFELIQDIIETNLLTKFHEDWK
ncbi:hypothetical protein DPMN_179870 [Dreissena polymorpha]|uniref:Uncharacterized protein n=1 Tax=Dreissena polymorpha TaxID=45954 RepID=A0A9D4EI15_DREPO|nr:hypothetical protein DPMN_179870 [Dreissena polymorpha]